MYLCMCMHAAKLHRGRMDMDPSTSTSFSLLASQIKCCGRVLRRSLRCKPLLLPGRPAPWHDLTFVTCITALVYSLSTEWLLNRMSYSVIRPIHPSCISIRRLLSAVVVDSFSTSNLMHDDPFFWTCRAYHPSSENFHPPCIVCGINETRNICFNKRSYILNKLSWFSANLYYLSPVCIRVAMNIKGAYGSISLNSARSLGGSQQVVVLIPTQQVSDRWRTSLKLRRNLDL
jgi:hypothetical protein